MEAAAGDVACRVGSVAARVVWVPPSASNSLENFYFRCRLQILWFKKLGKKST
jgi:hypothetical protein